MSRYYSGVYRLDSGRFFIAASFACVIIPVVLALGILTEILD